jgi:hypothetical protein
MNMTTLMAMTTTSARRYSAETPSNVLSAQHASAMAGFLASVRPPI